MSGIKPTGVEAAVCEDIARRQQTGIAKYGTTVAENPLELREWLILLYEELLDAAVYARRAIFELENRQPWTVSEEDWKRFTDAGRLAWENCDEADVNGENWEKEAALRELRELRETLREVAPDCRFHPSGICETCGTRRPCRGDIIREALEKDTPEAPGKEATI
jgi:hypothetical protein